jgi:hypothetical protein
MASFPKPSIFRDKVQAASDGGDKIGRTSKLKLTHAVSELLRWNEKAHETDETLTAMLAAEFPKREAAGERDGKRKDGPDRPRTIQSIAAYRAYYNAGNHGHNPDGKFGQSSSYNAEGVARAKPVAGGKKPAKKAKKPAKKPTAKKAKAPSA